MNEAFVEMKFVWIETKKKVSSILNFIEDKFHSSLHSEFLQDIVEVLIYILLPADEFRCVPARMIIRVNIFESLAMYSSFSRFSFKGNSRKSRFDSIYRYVHRSRCDQSIDYQNGILGKLMFERLSLIFSVNKFH